MIENVENQCELLACPTCKETLVRNSGEKAYQCMNHHSFDIAKQGYINLLMNSQKKTNLPGDSKEMVQARMQFLSKGYYSQLSEKIDQHVISLLESRNEDAYKILDIGCGTGYYTTELMKAVQDKNLTAFFYGLDMSKEAVKCASASNKVIRWVVGNSFYLPFQEDAFSCVLSIFSPVKIEECLRVMKKKGLFVRVLPGANHLIQIRDIIYEQVILNEGADPVDAYDGMNLMECAPVCFDISLEKEDLLSLVKMTPHYWKTSKQDKEPLNELERLTVTIDMQILVYEKN